MKVAIVEDVLHNSRLLEGMIRKIRPEWEIIGTLVSVSQTVEWFQNNEHPDLVFMDIQLTDGTSFAVFDSVDIKSMIIFTTAYDEYAIQAFKVNSVDYILKPVKEKSLLKAIGKFEDIHHRAIQETYPSDYDELLSAIQNKEKKYRSRLLISGVLSYYKIEIKDVAYFYAGNRVVSAVLFDGKEHIIDLTLEKLEEQLDPLVFFRTNRSHILNIDSINRFENYFGGKLMVTLEAPLNISVTISRLKATPFKNWLDGVVS